MLQRLIMLLISLFEPKVQNGQKKSINFKIQGSIAQLSYPQSQIASVTPQLRIKPN
uniref:Uncharacterized protein n=1 Tax=Arundo donax TaxID=35708 RepID=A0A0A9HE15_ARUDO